MSVLDSLSNYPLHHNLNRHWNINISHPLLSIISLTCNVHNFYPRQIVEMQGNRLRSFHMVRSALAQPYRDQLLLPESTAFLYFCLIALNLVVNIVLFIPTIQISNFILFKITNQLIFIWYNLDCEFTLKVLQLTSDADYSIKILIFEHFGKTAEPRGVSGSNLANCSIKHPIIWTLTSQTQSP